MKIGKVTITGADDRTSISEMEKISIRYPFVEWGILFGSQSKVPRYPSNDWVSEVRSRNSRLCLSAHLCGAYSRNVIENNDFHFVDTLTGIFERVQLNYSFKYPSFTFNENFVNRLLSYEALRFIFQYNNRNENAFQSTPIRAFTGFDLLVDASGGHGRTISSDGLKTYFGYYTKGYAGGIGPDNIDLICEVLKNNNFEDEVWIDMESKVRTDKELDLDKVQDVLKTVKKHFEL